MTLPSAIGDYEVLSLLGKGGMSEVYLVRLPGAAGFSKRAALKRMHLSEEGDERAMRSLINEARMVSQLHHPNLIDVFGFEIIDDAHCMVMEYVEGASLLDLNRYFRRQGSLPASEVIGQIASEVCAGLHYAHTHVAEDGTHLQLIHRDIKPANILLSRHGHVKVADFGIAKSAINPFQTTGDDVVKGTLAYMSPEQILGEGIDARSDLFSFGLVLFECLTQQRLIKTRNITELLETIHEGYRDESRALMDTIAPEWNPVLEGLLAASPAHRFQTAREVLEALDKHVNQSSRLQVGEIVEQVFQSIEEKKARKAGASTGEMSKTGQKAAALPSEAIGEVQNTAVMPPGSQPDVFNLAGGASASPGVANLGPEAAPSTTPRLTAQVLKSTRNPDESQAASQEQPPAQRSRVQLLLGMLLIVLGAGAAVAIMQTMGPAVPPPAPVLEGASRDAVRPEAQAAVAQADKKSALAPAPTSTPPPPTPPKPTPKRAVASAPAKAPARPAPKTAPAASRAAPGQLTVNAFPYATAYLDGVKKGYNIQEEVTAGSHTVKLVGPEGQEKIFTVEIKPGRKTVRVWSFVEERFMEQ